MKTRIYLRIGKSKRGPKVAVSQKPNHQALTEGSGRFSEKPIPTVCVGIDLTIDDKAFADATILLEANIKAAAATIKEVVQ